MEPNKEINEFTDDSLKPPKVRFGRVPPKKPTVTMLIDFYDACLRCDTLKQAAIALGTREPTLQKWIERFPALAKAKKLADKRRGGVKSLSGYVYNRLSAEARETWDKIQFWSGHNSATERIDMILSGKSTKVKQELFVHALVSSSFSVSTACNMVCIPYRTVRDWQEKDFEFREMIDEIQFHKKDFFEKTLIGLVEERHPMATIFVNRTINADRGYSEKITHQHTGHISHGINLDDLDLDIDTRRKILEAVRRKNALPPANEPKLLNQPVIDVEEAA